jgi:hypothetical protein
MCMPRAGAVDPAASHLLLKHGGQTVPVSALLDALPDGSQQWGDAWHELERQQEAEYGGAPLLTPEEVGWRALACRPRLLRLEDPVLSVRSCTTSPEWPSPAATQRQARVRCGRTLPCCAQRCALARRTLFPPCSPLRLLA